VVWSVWVHGWFFSF
jgi:hypothetical protein